MLSDNFIKYITVFGLSTVMVILLTPLFIKLAPRMGLMDIPDERCIHKKITPVGGGLVVFIAFNITCYLLYHYFADNLSGLINVNWWHTFFISSSILLIVGLIDDCFGMRPLVKLAGQAASCSYLYILSDYHVNLLSIDFGFFGGLVFVLIWTLAIINAFNLIDGLDGLCSGLSMISAIGLATVFILRGSPNDALVCIALIGACLGFLIYNFHPAKVFLGDTGSMFLGFTLASISLYAGSKSSFFVILAAPIFIAGIPLADTLLAVWRRSIRKTLAQRQGLPPIKLMQPDKDHLHHRLLDYGFNQRYVALVLYAVNILIVCVGLTFILFSELAIGLFLIIFLILIYILVKYVIKIELLETHKLVAPNKTVHLNHLTQFFIVFYAMFDLFWMSGAVWLANFIVLSGNVPSNIVAEWMPQLLLWEIPVFLLLIVFNTYCKVWQASYFRDYFLLLVAILVGSTISLALLLPLNPDGTLLLINKMSLFVLFSSIGIIGIRIPYRFIHEWGRDNFKDVNPNNILIYGAGAYGGLCLHECYLKQDSEGGILNVVGFIDDNVLLRNQYIHGKIVLGGLSELAELISTYSIDEIIVTYTKEKISDEILCQLKEIINNKPIKVSKWSSSSTQIVF